ncbi:MAG: ABC transporter permease [Acidobacteriota bacterium]
MGCSAAGNKWPGTMGLPARPDLGQITFPMRSVTPDYFALMGMKLLQGRSFTAGDKADARRVVIVNEAMAKKYFPGVDPVGQQMILPGDNRDTADVVGLVADTRTDALSRTPEPEIYFSFWQNGAFSKHLVVRAGSDPTELVASIRREGHAVDPTASVEHAITMNEIRRQSLATNTFAMRLLIGFAGVATLLALVGIYGVLSLSVGARLKEIAVRKAIGAQQGDILRATLGEGGRMIVIGTLLGAMLALLGGRAL